MPAPSAPLRRARLPRPLLIAIVGAIVLALGGGVAAIALGQQPAAPAGAEPSGPVSSGILHEDTRMGAVLLNTARLAEMRAFYEDAVGLTVLAESEGEVSLGRPGEELIRLVNDPVSPADTPTGAGLYHSAILYPDAASLAGALAGVAQQAPSSYQGSADHAVSLAFYIGDPDGNGVELYMDRPRAEWEWVDGRVTMGSAALDPNKFIADNLDPALSTAEPTMGHVHLRVGELGAARAFYVDVLGFDVTSETDGALFMSAGGYHHHLAANTWNSAGAGVRGASLGLREFTVILADGAELDAAAARLDGAGVPFQRKDGALSAQDPWGNTVRLATTAG
ncbi:VOC family protein [Microterricola viridarii]|uniref:Catechol 2,3-dioxygenase n=1 Tax=Microterricola viridarii TaxID=412690 RepID=A0A1H1SU30_9MICO|nr:VOC family protein [Microterricola viridarii]SDS51500.1 catechol 2,3-dioxygenase [Microterricola viridarii]